MTSSNGFRWMGLVTLLGGLGWSVSRFVYQFKPIFSWPAYDNHFSVSIALLIVGGYGFYKMPKAAYSRVFRIGHVVVSIGLVQMLISNITKVWEPVWMPLIFLLSFMIVSVGLCLQSIGMSHRQALPALIRALLLIMSLLLITPFITLWTGFYLAYRVSWPLAGFGWMWLGYFVWRNRHERDEFSPEVV